MEAARAMNSGRMGIAVDEVTVRVPVRADAVHCPFEPYRGGSQIRGTRR